MKDEYIDKFIKLFQDMKDGATIECRLDNGQWIRSILNDDFWDMCPDDYRAIWEDGTTTGNTLKGDENA